MATAHPLPTDDEIPASRLMRERDYARQRVLDQRAENDRLAERLDAAITREVAAYDRANVIAHERDVLEQQVAQLTEQRDRARQQFAASVTQVAAIMKWAAANLDAEQMASLLADPAIGRDCADCEGSGGAHCFRRDDFVECEAGCFGGRVAR